MGKKSTKISKVGKDKLGGLSKGPATNSGKQVGNNNSFAIAGYSIRDFKSIISLINEPEFEAGTIDNLICCGVAIIIMVQIRICCSAHPANYCDKLDSFKLYKKRFLGEVPGRAWCILIALVENIAVIGGLLGTQKEWVFWYKIIQKFVLLQLQNLLVMQLI